MEYEDIWQKIRSMSQRERKQLAHEVSRFPNVSHNGREAVGYIHPHYYFDAKAVHAILFYAPHSQHEIEDKDGKYYDALKEIIEDDKEIHVRTKRYSWMPRFINDWLEGNVVKSYICSRINDEYVNAYYRIRLDHGLAGERQRSLFITLKDNNKTIYKMTGSKTIENAEDMTFRRVE